MQTVKVLYLNDTRKTQYVHKYNLHKVEKEVPPADYSVVELEIPDGGGVFVKVWETGVVLISTTTSIPKE